MKYKIETIEIDGNLRENPDGCLDTWMLQSDEYLWDGNMKYEARDSFRRRKNYTKSEGYELHTGCSIEELGKMVFLVSVMTPWGCTDQNRFYQIQVSELK